MNAGERLRTHTHTQPAQLESERPDASTASRCARCAPFTRREPHATLGWSASPSTPGELSLVRSPGVERSRRRGPGAGALPVGASRCDLHREEWSSYVIQKRKEAERKVKAKGRK